VLSSSISGGSLSERIVNDLQARDRWLEAFKEAARFFNEHPPFEITFDPNLVQEGETDYAKRTANLAMRVALDPSDAGFAALNALLGGLEQTGRRDAWGFKGWPLLDVSPKTPGTVVFDGKQSFSFKLDVTLLNEKGKNLAKSSITLNTGTMRFAAGDKNIAAPEGAEGKVRFTNIKADDLTPTLTIVISAVNGIPSATLNANGYMRIDAGDLDKKNAAVYNNSGLAHASRGDYIQAITDYNRAIQLDPANTVYKDNLQAAVEAVQKAAVDYNTSGLAYFNKKEYDRAIADYHEAIRLDPSNTAYGDNLQVAREALAGQIAAERKAEAAAYNTSGLASFNKKEYDRAIADYNEAIRLDPSTTAYKDNLAAAQKAKADQIATVQAEAARKAEAERAAAQEALAAPYITSGNAYYDRGAYDLAIADYSRAVQLAPSNTVYKDKLQAARKTLSDQLEEARKAEVAARKAEVDAYINSGNAYYAAKDYDRAIADFTEAIRLDPDNVVAYYGRGNCYYMKAYYAMAITDYTQALKFDPNHANAKKWLEEARKAEVKAYIDSGNAYYATKDYDLAITDYTQAIRLDPNNAAAYNSRGNCSFMKANYRMAIADYAQALKLDPNHANAKKWLEEARKAEVTAYINSGNAYYAAEDYDRAIADFTEAIRLDPNNIRAYGSRGFNYAIKGDYQRAIADFTQVLRLDPNDTMIKQALEKARKMVR
jgi:tetratricopeptide (TPR) repeat protein